MTVQMQYEIENKAQLYFQSLFINKCFEKYSDLFFKDLSKVHKSFFVQNESQTSMVSGKFNPVYIIPKNYNFSIANILIKLKLNNFTFNFLHLILKEENLHVFIYMVKNYQIFQAKYKGFEIALIYSVIDLTDKQKADIEDVIKCSTKDNLFFIYDIDKTLLAGIKIKFKNKIYDCTLYNKLNRLEVLLKGQYNV